MNRRLFARWMSAVAAIGVSASLMLGAAPALAQEADGPDALITKVSNEVLETVKTDKAIQGGDLNKIIALVDAKVMPHVNFQRMTGSAVGRGWREATPEQKKRLEDEFKVLLVRTYSRALAEVKDQTIQVKPQRGKVEAETLVRTEIRGGGAPIQLDYRMEKTDKGWKIYDLNVMGIWIVQTYQTQFATEINKGGIAGLITTLSDRNKAAAAKK
jgi:phospholipid transport system substrate-binding protein